jgi:DNA-binding NarL/FixJ family response regulator
MDALIPSRVAHPDSGRDRLDFPLSAGEAPVVAATRIRVLVVEHQRLLRRAFVGMLDVEPDIEVVAEAADGFEAIQMARTHQPDLILTEINLPRLDGIAATRQILSDLPRAAVVILTTEAADAHVFAAITAGAQGYLMKATAEDEIVPTIRVVASGLSSLSPMVTRQVLNEIRRIHLTRASTPHPTESEEPLTGRESTILAGIATGKANKEIARDLHLTEGTVKNHVSRILSKLQARSRTELAVRALSRKAI